MIKLYRYLLRDALLYKLTLSKDDLQLKELEDDVITLANTYDTKALGKMVEGLNYLADANRNNINKKIALFNFLEV